MSMGCDLDAAPTGCIEDELEVVLGEPRQALLYDVVAVEIFDQGHRVQRQCAHHELDLRRAVELVDEFLDGSSTMHVERDSARALTNTGEELLPLAIVCVLKELLAQVVAEGVGHQLDRVGEHLHEDGVGDELVVFIQASLQIPASMLIAAEPDQFAWRGRQNYVGVSLARLRDNRATKSIRDRCTVELTT